MAARQSKVMTWGLVVLTFAVLLIVVAVIIGAVAKKGNVGNVRNAQQQKGHTLAPVTRASVKTCLSDHGIFVADKSGGKLEAHESGSNPVTLTFATSFDTATASVQPGRALNNVTLSKNVNDLTQLEIYAFDTCIVQPGEKNGSGTSPSKPAPVESLTS